MPSTPHPIRPQYETDTPRISRVIVPLLMAVSLVCYANRVSIATAGDTRIMAQYDYSPTRMGTVYSAFLMAYTLMMIPGGLYIDRVGPRAALRAVLAVSSIFVALTGVIGLAITAGAAAFPALLAVRGLMGAVSAPLYPACAAAIGRHVPPGGRSRANGLVNGSALVGVAITPLLFGALIDRFDWPAAFLIASALTLVLALFWHWHACVATGSSRQPPGEQGIASPATSPHRHVSWWSLLRNRGLLLLTLSYGAVGYFQYLFFYWMNYYFKTVLALPEARSRAYAAIPPLAMAVGMPLGGWLTDRLETVLGAHRGAGSSPWQACWRARGCSSWGSPRVIRPGSSPGSRWRWGRWGWPKDRSG